MIMETSKHRAACLILFGLILFSSQLSQSDGANVLFFIGFGGPSHRLAMQPLAEALSERGHNVTFLVQQVPQASNSSKIQYYSPKKVTEHFIKMRGDSSGGFNFYDVRASGFGPYSSLFVQSFGIKVCELLYADPSFLDWLKEGNKKFDLVIVDSLFNECGYGVAHAHGAKIILFSISTVLPWVVDSVGIPDETSYIPDVMLGYAPGMGFMQRMASGISQVFWAMFREFYTMPKLTKITREGLKSESFPSFMDIEKNISLVLVNTHPSQEYPRSLPANVIPVGGISWVEKDKENKALPKELEDFINQGKEGFVYVSFGSFIDFLTFPEDIQQRFINALSRLPNIQFIWKLNKTPENLPKNILVQKWLPQQDILYHSKIRAFVTHAGIGGVNEAIYTSVPLILFPIFTEQDYNAHLMESKGCGIKLEITELTEDKLESAIRKILADDSYKVNMEKVTKQFLDRPMKPLESAVWWTEYVLRQDTGFLQPHNLRQPWWVKRQLDVWLFLIFITISALFVSYKISKLIVNKCCCKSGNEVAKLSKKKQN